MAITPTLTPSDSDRVGAGRLRSKLSESLRGGEVEVTVGGDTMTLSRPAAAAIFSVLEGMEKGHALAVMTLEGEVSTREAARILNVSRPFVVGLLEKGAMLDRMVGTHHRIAVRDVLGSKEKMRARGKQLLDELTCEAQELGLGYQAWVAGRGS